MHNLRNISECSPLGLPMREEIANVCARGANDPRERRTQMKTNAKNARTRKTNRTPSAKRLANAILVMREYKRLMARATPADWRAFKADVNAALKAKA